MTRTEQLQQLREDSVAAIITVFGRLNIDYVYAYDIDAGSSPIIIPDANDGNLTYTLDKLEVDFITKSISVDASNCDDNVTLRDQAELLTDTLVALADWVEENEDKIREAYGARIGLYGDTWDMVADDPRTSSSWLCASFGDDQIWVDETEGKCFLKHEDNWYAKDI